MGRADQLSTILRRELHHLVSFQNAPWRWKVGLQALLALGIPAAIFTLAGHLDMALVASLGAFTALYFAGLHTSDRARLLPLIALSFSSASLLGAMVGSSNLFLVIFFIALTSLASILSLGTGLGPPGPMMFVLVGGVSNHLVRKGALADSPLGTWMIPALVAIGAIASYLIVIAPLVVPAVRRREGPAPRLADLLRFDHWDLTSRIIAYRVIVAVTIATLISVPANFDHSYWVVMVAGVVLQVSHSLRHTAVRVAHRMLGTLLGLITFSLLVALEPSGMWLILTIALLQGIVEVVVAKHYGLALMFITPLSLLIATANSSVPTSEVAMERIVDTLLGIAIAVVVLAGSTWLMSRGKRGHAVSGQRRPGGS